MGPNISNVLLSVNLIDVTVKFLTLPALSFVHNVLKQPSSIMKMGQTTRAPGATEEQKRRGKLMEQQIEILKASNLIRQIRGRPITKQILLDAIKALNDDCAYELGHLAQVRRIHSGDPTDTRYWSKKV